VRADVGEAQRAWLLDEQAVHPVPRAEHGLKPRLELREQVVQPKLWQQAAASRVLRASYING
jgi:hypothetical protein